MFKKYCLVNNFFNPYTNLCRGVCLWFITIKIDPESLDIR